MTMQKKAKTEFIRQYAEFEKIVYDLPDTVFGYKRREIMKFGLSNWEPKIFKAETQAAAVAVVSLAGWYFDMPVAATGSASVVVGYITGFLTVKPQE